MKHGKNYENAAKKIEAGKLYEVNDALALAIETATAKFDETIEIHIRLGVTEALPLLNSTLTFCSLPSALISHAEYVLLSETFDTLIMSRTNVPVEAFAVLDIVFVSLIPLLGITVILPLLPSVAPT